ncbi:MAG: hypothetical protein N2258_02050 [Brevinematales bacterium]|nr:hypothetical protein [Brevinematales bacterium]
MSKHFSIKSFINIFAIGMGVFLTSLVILCLESIMNRMFAATFWYHFAFIVLSIALFGIGVGGIFVYFTPKFLLKYTPIIVSLFAIVLAFVVPIVIREVNKIPLVMNAVAFDPLQQKYFKHFFMLLVIPFFLGGYIFSIVFTHFKEKITLLYFFDLIGGGLGVVFMLLFFPGNGPFVVVFYLGLAMIFVSFVFMFSFHWIPSLFILVAIPVYLLYFKDYKNLEIRVSSEKKDVSATGKILSKHWDNFGYVVMVEKTNGSKFVTADFTCYTYFYAPRKNVKEYQYITPAHNYPYIIKRNPENVGIVGVGAGKDVLTALGFGAKNIYGAEFNTTIYNLFKKYYSNEFKPEGSFSNVHIERQEGRFFLRTSKRKYDVLVFDNSISQVAVSSGSFTLAESYLFTVEAMIDYYNHLTDGGIVYLSNPLPHVKRFASLWKEAFKRLGSSKEFKNSIVIFAEENAGYPKCKILVKKGAFTSSEIKKLRAYTTSIGHKAIYIPGEILKNDVSELILTDNVKRIYAKSDQDLRPSTDDWPFFSQHVKPEHQELTSEVMKFRFYYPQPFLMLRQITGTVVFYSLIFLLVPILLLNIGGIRKLPNKFGTLLYFMALGLGFMLIENVLIQKYILILGHPTYSFSIVLASLLISAGIGSLFSEKIKNPFRAALIGCIGIVTSVPLVFLILYFLSSQIVGFSFAFRLILSIALIVFNGFFMGMMMPSGIRAISKFSKSIPWMWAINGIFSIVANFVSIYVSVLYGFKWTLLVGVIVYLIGTFFFVFKFKLRNA